jgi:cellulose biosynthesis protein BcsQ
VVQLPENCCKQVNIPQARYIIPSDKENIDVESLEQLIQKLPQSRVRTAARRLGIADRVDGKYQKLAVLRMQLQAKLESQPMEVAQVLRGLEI